MSLESLKKIARNNSNEIKNMKKVLYTLDAYGPNAEKATWFDRVSKRRNQHYADQCGASYYHLVIDEPNRIPPHYHKLEVFEHFLQSDFDRGVFFDMDILVENDCPSLWLGFPEGVAMCYDYLMPMGMYYQWCQDSYNGDTPHINYSGPTKHDKEQMPTWRYYNTGVIVFDRAFAEFILSKLKPIESQPSPDWIQYPDGWGEQHNVNYWLDKEEYPVFDLPREYNELCGITRSTGKYITHYCAPWGRLMLAQREIHPDQGSFQRKYLKGDILNVGSNTDYARLKADFGAYNIDLRHNDQLTGMGYPIDEVMDARKLDPEWTRRWDTVVLGEILEHMNKEDRIQTLKEAIRVTKKNGWINITIPHDERDVFDQHSSQTHDTDSLEYEEGISAFHAFNYTDEMCRADIAEVGLELVAVERMQYGFHNPKDNEPVRGSCYLCVKPAHRQRMRDNCDLIFDTPQPEDGECVIVPKDQLTVDQANLMYGHQNIDWKYA